jgi:hypothetical protein
MTTTTNEPTYLVVDGYQLLFIVNPADPNYNPSTGMPAGTPYASYKGAVVGDIKVFSKGVANQLVAGGYAEYIVG